MSGFPEVCQTQKVLACVHVVKPVCLLCRHSVSDIAWAPDGMRLLACSGDGTVAVLHFDTSELGMPLTQVQLPAQ